jgi:hypothetical protein
MVPRWMDKLKDLRALGRIDTSNPIMQMLAILFSGCSSSGTLSHCIHWNKHNVRPQKHVDMCTCIGRPEVKCTRTLRFY